MDFGINLRILDFRSDAEGAKQRTKIMCQNKEGVALPRSCSAVLHSPRSLLNLPVPKWPQIAWQYPSKTTEARNMQLLFRPTIATKWNCRKLSFDISSSKNNSTNVCCGQFFFSALSPYTQKKRSVSFIDVYVPFYKELQWSLQPAQSRTLQPQCSETHQTHIT